MNRSLAKILGFGVDTFTSDEAAEYIAQNGGQVITINPEMIMNALKNPDFANVINSAELVIPDSVGVELGLKISGKKVKRIPGIEFGKTLLRKFAMQGKKTALIGAKPEVLQKAAANLKTEIPELNVVYSNDGYFSDDEKIIEEIVNSAPDLILAALGSPKQEFFISELKKRLPDAVMIGLGGSFDVWAGVVERAPVFYQKTGLEWLYRTVTQPERLKRIFPVLPLFVLRVIKERLTGK